MADEGQRLIVDDDWKAEAQREKGRLGLPMVGKRLKHGGARWHVPRVENVAALCCLLYSDEWEAFWQADAA